MRKEEFALYELPSMRFYHNLGGNIEAAIAIWIARTRTTTVKSLADYVKDKSDRYNTGHKILSEEEYNKLS